MPEKGQTPPTARPHPPSLAAASSSSASSQAVGASFFQDRLRLRVSGALPAANARYMANSPSCGVAALHVLTAQPLARLTLRLENPMAHLVHVPACQGSTARCWWGGSASFAQSIEKFNLFSFIDAFESRRHPHIGGLVVGSHVVCGRPAGSKAARSAVACSMPVWSLCALGGAMPGHVGSCGILGRCLHVRPSVAASSGGILRPSAHRLSFAVLV